MVNSRSRVDCVYPHIHTKASAVWVEINTTSRVYTRLYRLLCRALAARQQICQRIPLHFPRHHETYNLTSNSRASEKATNPFQPAFEGKGSSLRKYHQVNNLANRAYLKNPQDPHWTMQALDPIPKTVKTSYLMALTQATGRPSCRPPHSSCRSAPFKSRFLCRSTIDK